MTTAIIGLAILLLSGVLHWQDLLNERGAWDTLIWFAVVVIMVSQLNSLGLITWFGDKMGGFVADFD